MNTIEKVKHGGAVKALKERINSLQFAFRGNWDDTKKGNKYTSLGMAILDGKRLLDEMQETLDALRELEPENE